MEYSGFWIRLAAWLIDVVLLSIIIWGIVNVAYFIGYIVGALTLVIGFLMVAFDDRKQGLHDKIANTYVIPLREGSQ